MKPIWLLEKNIFDNEQPLIDTILREGYQIKYVSDDLSGVQELSDKCVIYYGSLNLAIKLKQFNLVPGVYGGDVKKYNVSNYRNYFSKFMLNDQSIYMTFGDLKHFAETKNHWLFNISDKIFVRPDSILKEFSGMVVSKNNFIEAVNLMSFYDDVVTPNLSICISKFKPIESEFRFVVVDGEVISGSMNRFCGKESLSLCESTEVYDFARKMIKIYNPDKVWTLDICKSNNEYKILEIGSFSYAELYANQLEWVVKAVSECAKNEKL